MIETLQSEFDRWLERLAAPVAGQQHETEGQEVESFWGKHAHRLRELTEQQQNKLLVNLVRREMQFLRRSGAAIDPSKYARKFPRFEPDFFSDLLCLPELPRQTSMDLVLPTRYRSLEMIGSGGVGSVWRALDTTMDRSVAIKMLRSDLTQHELARTKLQSEAQLTGRLQHPGIPPVYDRGQLANGAPYFAMKLVEGQTLGFIMQTDDPARTELESLLPIFLNVAQTLAYAHDQGLVHRDLKPENIMVGQFGEVQVMDWGMARNFDAAPTPLVGDQQLANQESCATSGSPAVQPSEDPALPDDQTLRSAPSATRQGDIVGTPAYMAPEQARGELDRISPQTDVFSLGIILFEIISHQRAYPNQSADSILKSLQDSQPLNLADRLPRTTPPPLVDICIRCCANDPASRYDDASHVAAAIEQYQVEASRKREQLELERQTWQIQQREDRKRSQVRWTAAAIILAVSLLGTCISVWQWRSAVASAKQARIEADKRVQTSDINSFLVMDFLGQLNLDELPQRDLQVKQVLDRASKRVDGQFKDRPLVAAQIRKSLASGYTMIGEYKKGLAELSQAHDLWVEHRSADDSFTWQIYHNMARLREKMGDNEIALSMFGRLIDHLGKLDPAPIDWLLDARSERANVLATTGDYLGAEKEISSVVQAEEAMEIVGLSAILQHRILWASFLVELGRFERASEQLNLAQTDFEFLGMIPFDPQRGYKHQLTMSYLSWVSLTGRIHQASGDLDQAEKLHREAWDLSCQVFGDQFHDSLNYVDSLAQCLILQQKYEEANELLNASIVKLEKMLGNQHEDSLAARNSLASLLLLSGDLEASEKLFLEIREMLQKLHPQGHYDLVTNYNNLGGLYLEMDQLDLAASEFSRAIEENTRLLGRENPRTIVSLANLARTNRLLGKLDEAESIYLQAIELSEQVYPEHHPETLRSIEDLAMMLQRTKREQDAEPWLRKLLTGYEVAKGIEHPKTRLTRLMLGWNLNLREEFEQAHPFFLAVARAELAEPGIQETRTFANVLKAASNAGKAGQFTDGIELLRDALQSLLALPQPQAEKLVQLELNLAQLLLGNLPEGEPPGSLANSPSLAEAESLLLKAYEALNSRKPANGKTQQDRQRAGRMLVRLYEMTGDQASAEHWSAELETIDNR